jgi:hypothetical protein
MTSVELNRWVTAVVEVPAALAAQACFAIRARAGVEVVEVPAEVAIPRFVRAPAAVDEPVPPSVTATSVPFQTPVVIVPKVVIED